MELAREIFAAIGIVAEVREDQIDAATARAADRRLSIR